MARPPRPAPSAPAPCPPAYGLRPGASAAVGELARAIERILDAGPEAEVPARVREALRPVVRQPDLVAPVHQASDPERYRRHVLFADPRGRFTLLALVWLPGQGTAVHGHSAWGAVGVVEGTPNVAVYRCTEEGGRRVATLVRDVRCAPGEVSCVAPGYGDVHRIYNAGPGRVLTLHAYGRDLVQEPESINLVVAG